MAVSKRFATALVGTFTRGGGASVIYLSCFQQAYPAKAYQLTLNDIPLEAQDYVVNGKPALEWLMEHYQFSKDKAIGITNDLNDWCREHDTPCYIVDIIKRVTRVRLETMKIVNALPALNEQ